MLAWVMNMGFAASPTGAPPIVIGAPQQGIFIGIAIAIRCLLLISVLGAML